MNLLKTDVRTSSSGGALLFLLAVSGMLSLLVLGIASSFRLGGDTRALRDALMAEINTPASGGFRGAALKIGPLMLGSVRAGLNWVDLPAEAREALKSIGSVEAGIYQLHSGETIDAGKGLAAANQAMEKRGWDRVVGVVGDGDMVAVYARPEQETSGCLRLCVAVLSEEKLIIGKASGNVEALLGMIMREHMLPPERWFDNEGMSRTKRTVSIR